jgi:putative nucleotidyltransferase with HDIG domain
MNNMTILTINVSQLVPGMILAEDVYTARKERILSRNTIITQKSIMKLKLNAVTNIIVYIPKHLVDQTPHEEPAKANDLKNSMEFKRFKKNYMESVNLLKNSFQGILGYSSEKFDPMHLLYTASSLLKGCRSSLRTFDMLQCMHESDDLVYVHSMNVTLICASFASWLNFSSIDMQQLMLAAMLHDIGKLQIPKEIIHKPTALTKEEFTLIQKHPSLGYELVKTLNLDSRIADAVLMHHERCDGSGYPSHHSLSSIPPFAKIIGIADVYDAMTSNRVYRNGICPFDVIRNFEEEGFQKYDAAYLLPFLESLAQAHMNASVRLSNSLVGEIVMVNRMALSRPVVKVANQFFDLSKDKDLQIISVL